MNRTETACMILLGTALLLTGALVSRLPSWAAPAQADMVASRDAFTAMTAVTANGEEALFVIDTPNDLLLIYNFDARGGGRLQLVNAVKLADEFAKPFPGAN